MSIYDLSPRELEILKHVAHAETNKVIGKKLVLEQRTIENQMYSVYKKLNLNNVKNFHHRVAATLIYIHVYGIPHKKVVH